ncbi:protein kinase 2, partial [Reticulomyxa filosa]
SNSNSNSNGNGNDNSKHDGNAELLALTQQREKLTAELRIVCNSIKYSKNEISKMQIKKKYKKKVLTQPSLRSSSLASLAVVNHIRSDDFIPLTNVLRRMIEKQFPIFQTVEHIILDLQ